MRRHCRSAQLQVAANHLVEVIDPDTVDQTLEQQLAAQERKALASAWFTGQYGSDGIARGRFALPNLVFGMLTKHLEAHTSPRRVATGTHTDKDAALPAETTVEDLPYGNRLGRALCELIEHLPVDGHPQHGVANATIVVTVDETKLRAGAGEATLDTGSAISIGETRRLACNAGILPIVMSGESKILDLGTSRRLFDRHQRLALATRDQGCVFPGAGERPPASTRSEDPSATNASNPDPADLRARLIFMDVAEQVIRSAETRASALAEADSETLLRLLHQDFRWTSHRGETYDRAEYIRRNTQGVTVWRSQQLRGIDVVVVGDTAVLYAEAIDVVLGDDDEPTTFRMPMTQVWVGSGAGWRCLAGHAGPRRT